MLRGCSIGISLVRPMLPTRTYTSGTTQAGSLPLYWYSQTVGLDRGIQDAIRAAGLLQGKIQLHVRGTIALSVRCELESVARESGVAGQIHFHPQVAPRDLLSRAAEHDVGLAL